MPLAYILTIHESAKKFNRISKVTKPREAKQRPNNQKERLAKEESNQKPYWQLEKQQHQKKETHQKKSWNGGKIGTEKVTYLGSYAFFFLAKKTRSTTWKTVQRSWIEQGIGSWHRYKYSTETFSSQNLKQKHHKWSKTGAEIERRKETEQKRRSVHWKQQRGEVKEDRFVRFLVLCESSVSDSSSSKDETDKKHKKQRERERESWECMQWKLGSNLT